MIHRRLVRLLKERKRSLLAGAALSLAIAGGGLWWRHGHPPNAAYYFAESERQIQAGDLQGAVNALRRATRAIPDNPDLRLKIAELYLKLNQLPAAEAWARFAKQTGAEDSRVDPILATAMLQQNKLTALIKMVEPGGRDAAAEADVRVSLALAHIYLGDLRIGEQLLADAKQRTPSAPRLAVGFARLALANDDLAGAKALLAMALAAAPHALETLRLEADVQRIGGDPEGALAVLAAALQHYPDDLATLVAHADILIARDRLDDAETDVDHALELAPQSLTPNFLRAVIVARRGDFVKADELVTAMSQFFTALPAGYYLQGIVKYQIGQYPTARDSLLRYLGRHADDRGALRLLALIAVHDGDNRRAIELLQPIVNADPTDRMTVGVLARAYLAAGNKDAAVAVYEKPPPRSRTICSSRPTRRSCRCITATRAPASPRCSASPRPARGSNMPGRWSCSTISAAAMWRRRRPPPRRSPSATPATLSSAIFWAACGSRSSATTKRR